MCCANRLTFVPVSIRLANAAFAAKDYDQAIALYTAAIAIDSKNCVYFSNRR
jgi:tetratricopeptide (TPR) repeat protein